ncbi:MCE family protein [Mycobacterium sp. CBMA293]|uniref:MlaD family protein n=1 Tax=unclassified Mycolicibacterium TaxID=2636767 RepID=UPI0012DDD1B5|nr:MULTISPECIES: MlaD family protein [unclassified Mycolicibacterium]MUL47425.1 MCE family protein [Mycolicibacterium sp. CBMA 360]MUL59410.1 MCE family protein [Mycolicibacterium sp. CBMA 335]MUL71135.1 MCE family protein [Mycolicibacterium sp. CBMA 311]MUL94778.1 MCE family protein [Mycolicibacterium sp. CBMA 230]MUM03619.1 mammalian cell entry protein [Mycolicibacterium sp. CBMA 213]
MTRRKTLRVARGAAAGVLATLLTACGAGLESMPLPSPGASGPTYRLTAIFSNALNLPAKAKVRLFGADIGEVTAIRAKKFTAHVVMQLKSDVALREGSTVELRSATPLGDVFVQIRPNADRRARMLHDGDEIPLGSTAAAPTVEELLNSLALLVNGGAIRALTTDINGAGRAVGGRGQKLAELIAETTTFLSRMAARSQQLDATLRSTAQMAAELAAHRDTLNAALDSGAPALAAISENTTRIADVVDTVGRITRQLSRFPSLQGTDTRSTIADLNRLSAVFNDISVDPNLSLTAFNQLLTILIKSTNSTSAHALLEVSQLALVPLPDKNYPGDTGFHGPDGTDWHAMIGGLRYEWNMLLGKINGPERP